MFREVFESLGSQRLPTVLRVFSNFNWKWINQSGRDRTCLFVRYQGFDVEWGFGLSEMSQDELERKVSESYKSSKLIGCFLVKRRKVIFLMIRLVLGKTKLKEAWSVLISIQNIKKRHQQKQKRGIEIMGEELKTRRRSGERAQRARESQRPQTDNNWPSRGGEPPDIPALPGAAASWRATTTARKMKSSRSEMLICSVTWQDSAR